MRAIQAEGGLARLRWQSAGEGADRRRRRARARQRRGPSLGQIEPISTEPAPEPGGGGRVQAPLAGARAGPGGSRTPVVR
jgi:hypothetical protein